MLTFRVDAGNFAQGWRAGVRIVPGTGLKVDFDEFPPDAGTLGLWHLHDGGCQGEGSGLEDASGGGRPLVNYGAQAVEDGYRFVRAEADYMRADGFVFASPQPLLTAECWVRDWQTGLNDTGMLVTFTRTSSPENSLTLYGRAAGASSFLRANLTIDGANIGVAMWTSAEVEALLADPRPWHIAAVLEAPNRLSLYVNGEKRSEDTTGILPLAAGTYRLFLGSSSTTPSAVLDEARLSTAARYAAAFTPWRLLASGAYASPTHDAVRVGTVWLGLAPQVSLPTGTDATWETRAADDTGPSGEPVGPWQPYDGTPASLPCGRFFQWRATLSATADRLTSPVVQAVDSLASEVGYNLYHAVGDGPEALDYASPWALVGPGVTEADTAPLAAGAVHWFGIRPVGADGTESPVAQDEVRLELDAQGSPVPDRPAGVLDLGAGPQPGGAVRLQWRYRVGFLGVVPQAFRVFGDGGTGTIDYDSPLAEVPFREADETYAWRSDPLTEGVEHQLAVRAVTAAGTLDEQPAVVRATPDGSAPGPVDLLQAEAIL